MIPAELLTKYGLREADALEAVESAITRTLTKALRSNIAVRLNGRLEITMFPLNGEPVELPPGEISRKLQRHILHNIELELQKRQALREAEEFEKALLRNDLSRGQIEVISIFTGMRPCYSLQVGLCIV